MVTIPPGTYATGGGADTFVNLAGKSNIILLGDGPGTIISVSGVDVGIGVASAGSAAATNITIRDLKITGSSARAICFAKSGCSQIRVEDCTIEGATLLPADGSTAGIYLGNTTDAWLENNYLSANGYKASDANLSSNIMVDAGCSRVVVAKNTCVTGTITNSPVGGTGSVTLVLGMGGENTNLVNGSGTSFAAGDVGKALQVAGNRVIISAVNVGTQQLTLELVWQWTAFTSLGYSLVSYTGNAVAVGIAVQGSGDFEIVDNYVSGPVSKPSLQSWGFGVMLYKATTIQYNIVSRNRIHNCGGPGIYLQLTPHTIASDNIVEDTCKTINSVSLVMATIVLTYESTHCIVAQNLLKAGVKNGIEFQGPNCTIVENVIQDFTTGFGIVLRAYTANLLTNAIISGNTVLSCLGGITTSAFSANLRSAGATIRGNVIDVTTNANNGIGCSYFSDLVVSGNTIKSASGYGIAVTDCDNLVLTNNLVKNASQNSNNLYSGIYLASVTQAVVADNRAGSGDSSPKQKCGIEEQSGTGILIANNVVYNYATSGISIGGSSVSRSGNRVSQSGPLSGRKQLSAGSGTVPTTEVLSGDNILLTVVVPDATAADVGAPRVDSIIAGTSFDIKSTNANDDSTVFWQIVH